MPGGHPLLQGLPNHIQVGGVAGSRGNGAGLQKEESSFGKSPLDVLVAAEAFDRSPAQLPQRPQCIFVETGGTAPVLGQWHGLRSIRRLPDFLVSDACPAHGTAGAVELPLIRLYGAGNQRIAESPHCLHEHFVRRAGLRSARKQHAGNLRRNEFLHNDRHLDGAGVEVLRRGVGCGSF